MLEWHCMKTYDAIIIVVWTIGAIAALANLVLSSILFDSLKQKYPIYHKLLGQPEVKIIGQRNIFLHPELQRAQAFIYSLVLRGIPEEFPEDCKLRRFASVLRLTVPTMIVSFVAFVVAGYASTHK